MDLNTVWFSLIAVLFIGFFFLEGFDYGVGMLLPFLGRGDNERRVLLNTIGPFWDGNEVWLLTAGGAMFAAFPHWYATMFSGFYLALILMLFALIIRGAGFEFRSKIGGPRWRGLWDWAIFGGSLAPALLWGVAIGNLMRGVPIGENMNYAGTFWDLLRPYALLGGMAFVALFLLHGAVFLSLRTEGSLLARSRRASGILWLPAVVLVALFIVAGYFVTDLFARASAFPTAASLMAAVALLLAGWFVRAKRDGWAFVMTGVTITLAATTVFTGLFPRLMISSLNRDWSLTVYNASSSPYTLQVMAIVALIFVPIVLLYQGWTYWVFRRRVGATRHLEY